MRETNAAIDVDDEFAICFIRHFYEAVVKKRWLK